MGASFLFAILNSYKAGRHVTKLVARPWVLLGELTCPFCLPCRPVWLRSVSHGLRFGGCPTSDKNPRDTDVSRISQDIESVSTK